MMTVTTSAMETIMIGSVELSHCHGNSAVVKDGPTQNRHYYHLLSFFLMSSDAKEHVWESL